MCVCGTKLSLIVAHLQLVSMTMTSEIVCKEVVQCFTVNSCNLILSSVIFVLCINFCFLTLINDAVKIILIQLFMLAYTILLWGGETIEELHMLLFDVMPLLVHGVAYYGHLQYKIIDKKLIMNSFT